MLRTALWPVANVAPIAVVHIGGAIVSEPSREMIESWEAYACIDDLAEVYRGIRDDGDILGVMTLIDSPGGEVLRFDHVIHAIKTLAAAKPTLAVVDQTACSDAYRIAACHARIWATGPTAIVGSIGAMYLHTVRAGQLDKQGLSAVAITAGEGKDAFHGHRMPTPDEIASKQRVVDAMRDDFVADVAAGRGMTTDDVLALGAHQYTAADGIGLGLVDEIRPLEGIDLAFAEQALGLTLERAS